MDKPGSDRRVEDALALANSSECIDKNGDVGYAVLQQIADPFGMLLEESHRVARLKVVSLEPLDDPPVAKLGQGDSRSK